MLSKIRKEHLLLFSLSIGCSVISSLSLLGAIMVNSEGENKVQLVVFALMFWIGLMFEQIFFWNANKLRVLDKTNRKHRNQGNPGVISLSQYRECRVVDVVFIISLVVLIICVIFSLGKAVVQFVLICLVVLSFRLHCFLSGRNYRYIKSKERKVDRKNG